MATRELQKNEWQPYFDFFSKNTDGRNVEIEVAGLHLGDQIAGQWVPLEGLSYDSENDVFYVHTPRLDHQISHPRRIYAREEAGLLSSIEVLGGDGNANIIHIKEPLRLPAS